MHFNKKFLIILLILSCINIMAVSANDFNSTEIVEMENGKIIESKEEVALINATGENIVEEKESVEKTTPVISVSSNNVNCKDTIDISIKDSSGTPLKSKKFSAVINNKVYSLKTNSMGYSTLGIDLSANIYKLSVIFEGDDEFNDVSKIFSIKVSKFNTKITPSANFVMKNNYLYFRLTDNDGTPISGKKITIKFKGKTYIKKTNSKGKAYFKVKSSKSKNSIKVIFRGDNHYNYASKKMTLHVVKKSLSIHIGNNKFLTQGFIRVYLKTGKSVYKKTIVLTVGSKKLKLKTNSEGIAIFKPNVNKGAYTVKAKYGKYYSAKYLKCYEGNVKDPLKEVVDYNGAPDIDIMPGNYVMGDGNAKYTLKKSQYREVLKRDSYCLFLNNKLPKYTFFKTKNHPKLNHIIKREKWNVIERAIYTKLIKKDKPGYWPRKITVSLKGKAYKYPEVRDVQDNGVNCGPTSCSMCSQVLKNYVCEKYFAYLEGTNKYGTSCDHMIKGLQKKNFIAKMFFKSSFDQALQELKKGGAALIFHADNHYVSILDISSDGKKVLVSNSYHSYDRIPTKWNKVSYMKKKFSHWDESLIVKLNYKLSDSTKNSINNYYASMGKNWFVQNTRYMIGGNLK